MAALRATSYKFFIVRSAKDARIRDPPGFHEGQHLPVVMVFGDAA
jgi:hypothetical protein